MAAFLELNEALVDGVVVTGDGLAVIGEGRFANDDVVADAGRFGNTGESVGIGRFIIAIVAAAVGRFGNVAVEVDSGRFVDAAVLVDDGRLDSDGLFVNGGLFCNILIYTSVFTISLVNI